MPGWVTLAQDGFPPTAPSFFQTHAGDLYGAIGSHGVVSQPRIRSILPSTPLFFLLHAPANRSRWPSPKEKAPPPRPDSSFTGGRRGVPPEFGSGLAPAVIARGPSNPTSSKLCGQSVGAALNKSAASFFFSATTFRAQPAASSEGDGPSRPSARPADHHSLAVGFHRHQQRKTPA